MKKLLGFAAIAAAALAISGCSTYPAGFSDKSVPMDQGR